ncbi:hypothetical protein [Methanobrevibacter sp.]|uniref:hypothetical protein n=1 Tax=Methanobrevibacter sp. TaxID=66852 RepID=UPI0039760D04
MIILQNSSANVCLISRTLTLTIPVSHFSFNFCGAYPKHNTGLFSQKPDANVANDVKKRNDWRCICMSIT